MSQPVLEPSTAEYEKLLIRPQSSSRFSSTFRLM